MANTNKYGPIKETIIKQIDDSGGILLDEAVLVAEQAIRNDFLQADTNKEDMTAAFEMLEFLMEKLQDSMSQTFVVKLVSDLCMDPSQTVFRECTESMLLKTIEEKCLTKHIVLWKDYNIEWLSTVFDEFLEKNRNQEILKNVILHNLIPEMMNLNTPHLVRNILLEFSFKLLPHIPPCTITNSEFEEFSNNIINTYIVPICELRDSEYENWHKLWILVLKLSDEKIHHSVTLTNHMLRIVEHAFKNIDTCEQRLRGFECWNELINNAALNYDHLSSTKQIKLLLTPLKAKFFKQDEVILKRFELFVNVIEKLGPKATLCLSEFLEFCFGSPNESTDPKKKKPRHAKAIKDLWVKIITALLELLGHTDECSLKLFKFDTEILTPDNIDPFLAILVKSISESCILLNDSQFDSSRDQISQCLWSRLFDIVSDCNKEITQKTLEVLLPFLEAYFEEFPTRKLIIGNFFYVIISKNSEFTNVVLKHLPVHFLPVIISSVSIKPYNRKLVQTKIYNNMDNPKTFKFFLENFNKIQLCEEINLTMACDFWLACSKYVLLDIFNNEAYQYSSYLVWPVQYYFQIEDVTSKEIDNAWAKVYQKVCKDSGSHKLQLLEELEKVYELNSSLSSNVLKFIEAITSIEEIFTDEFVTKLMKITTKICSTPIATKKDLDLIVTILKLYLNTNLSFYQESTLNGVNNICLCIEKTIKCHGNFEILPDLLSFLEKASGEVKSAFSKSLIDLKDVQCNDKNLNGVLVKVLDVLGIKSIDNGSSKLPRSRAARIANYKGNPYSPKNEAIENSKPLKSPSNPDSPQICNYLGNINEYNVRSPSRARKMVEISQDIIENSEEGSKNVRSTSLKINRENRQNLTNEIASNDYSPDESHLNKKPEVDSPGESDIIEDTEDVLKEINKSHSSTKSPKPKLAYNISSPKNRASKIAEQQNDENEKNPAPQDSVFRTRSSRISNIIENHKSPRTTPMTKETEPSKLLQLSTRTKNLFINMETKDSVSTNIETEPQIIIPLENVVTEPKSPKGQAQNDSKGADTAENTRDRSRSTRTHNKSINDENTKSGDKSESRTTKKSPVENVENPVSGVEIGKSGAKTPNPDSPKIQKKLKSRRRSNNANTEKLLEPASPKNSIKNHENEENNIRMDERISPGKKINIVQNILLNSPSNINVGVDVGINGTLPKSNAIKPDTPLTTVSKNDQKSNNYVKRLHIDAVSSPMRSRKRLRDDKIVNQKSESSPKNKRVKSSDRKKEPNQTGDLDSQVKKNKDNEKNLQDNLSANEEAEVQREKKDYQNEDIQKHNKSKKTNTLKTDTKNGKDESFTTTNKKHKSQSNNKEATNQISISTKLDETANQKISRDDNIKNTSFQGEITSDLKQVITRTKSTENLESKPSDSDTKVPRSRPKRNSDKINKKESKLDISGDNLSKTNTPKQNDLDRRKRDKSLKTKQDKDISIKDEIGDCFQGDEEIRRKPNSLETSWEETDITSTNTEKPSLKDNSKSDVSIENGEQTVLEESNIKSDDDIQVSKRSRGRPKTNGRIILKPKSFIRKYSLRKKKEETVDTVKHAIEVVIKKSQESEDIIDNSQTSSINITPMLSPNVNRSSRSPKKLTSEDKASNSSLTDTITPSDSESPLCDNLVKVSKTVIKFDLPKKPDLTDSEKIVSEMDTVTLLSEQIAFDNTSTSVKNTQQSKLTTSEDVKDELDMPGTPVSKTIILPASPVNGDTPNKTKELLNDTHDISPIGSQDVDEDADLKTTSPETQTDSPDNKTKTRMRRMLRRDSDTVKSPSSSRVRKLMSKLNLEQNLPKVKNKTHVFEFKKSVPSPLAKPKSSILKRKLSELSEEDLPASKKKRVNFSCPATTSRKVILKESKDIFSELDDIESEQSLDIINAHLLDNENPIYSKLVSCSDDVMEVLKQITSPMVAKVWHNELSQQKIATVGDLASKTETEVNRLPLKSPVVSNVYKALDRFYQKKELEGSSDIDCEVVNDNCKEQLDFLMSKITKPTLIKYLLEYLSAEDVNDVLQHNSFNMKDKLALSLATKSVDDIFEFHKTTYSNVPDDQKNALLVKLLNFVTSEVSQRFSGNCST